MDYSPAGYCPKCGYRIDPGTCPECGRSVTRPWRTHPRVVRRWLWVALAVALAAGTLGWYFRWSLAERYAPSSVFIWMWRNDFYAPDWAAHVLLTRLQACCSAGEPHALNRRFDAANPMPAGHDWAGSYSEFHAWDLGARSLSVNPKAFMWNLPARMQLGPVIEGGVRSFDSAILRLDIPQDRELLRWARVSGCWSGKWIDSELVLIRWSDWRFLVAKEELTDFCNDVNAGEPLPELHLTRRPERFKAVGSPCRPETTDRPQLPSPHDLFLLDEPIVVEIVAVSKRPIPTRGPAAVMIDHTGYPEPTEAHIYELELALPATRSVFRRMRFYSSERFGIAHVTTFDSISARALYVEIALAGGHRPLVPGELLSTLAPRPVPLQSEIDSLRHSTLFPDLPSATGLEAVAQQRSPVLKCDWLLREICRELLR